MDSLFNNPCYSVTNGQLNRSVEGTGLRQIFTGLTAMADDRFVPVYGPNDFLEADAIRQHLQSLGIFCHLEGEQQASLAGSSFFGNTGCWPERTTRSGYGK